MLVPGHPDAIRSLHALVRFYRKQERYADAESLLVTALAKQEETLGPDHPGVARPLSNLAGLYHAQGRYEEAESISWRNVRFDDVRKPRDGRR